MKIVPWILNCYPRRWRERYQEEMLAVLEQHTISHFTILDLLLGALDARLDPAYRTQEGFMFHRLRDTRTLSTVYIGALAVALFSLQFWEMLSSSLAFQDNFLGSTTNSLVGYSMSVIPGISLIALLVVAIAMFKNHRSGTRIFAMACFSFGIAAMYPVIPFSHRSDYPLVDLILALLLIGGIALITGASLFVTGIKGLKLFQARQWWPIVFALLIDVLLPAVQIAYEFWGMAGQITIVRGQLLVVLLVYLMPYMSLGALLLTLASNEPDTRSWRVTRGFGIVFALALVVDLIAMALWDVNRWMGGGVWIFDPSRGVWPLFGGQWIGALIANALILAVAFGLALLALIRSFMIQHDEEPSERQLAA